MLTYFFVAVLQFSYPCLLLCCCFAVVHFASYVLAGSCTIYVYCILRMGLVPPLCLVWELKRGDTNITWSLPSNRVEVPISSALYKLLIHSWSKYVFPSVYQFPGRLFVHKPNEIRLHGGSAACVSDRGAKVWTAIDSRVSLYYLWHSHLGTGCSSVR